MWPFRQTKDRPDFDALHAEYAAEYRRLKDQANALIDRIAIIQGLLKEAERRLRAEADPARYPRG